MADKFNFNGPLTHINIKKNVTEFDVKEDLYGEWKRWVMKSDNSKYIPALRTVAGDPISDTLSIAPYYFLINGWTMCPWSGDYNLTINGNLYTDPPSATFTVTPSGDTSILIQLETSANAQLVNGGSGALTTAQDEALSRIDSNTQRILGLVHENFFVDQSTYDAYGNLISARVRLYSDSGSVGTSANILATYQVDSPHTAPGKMTYFKQIYQSSSSSSTSQSSSSSSSISWVYPLSTTENISTLTGNLSSVYDLGLNDLTIEETTGVTGFDIDFIFENIPSESDQLDLRVKGNYSGILSHNVKLRIYNYNTTVWDDVTVDSNDFNDGAFDNTFNLPASISDYISSGQLKIKVIHTSAGNPTHQFDIDYMILSVI